MACNTMPSEGKYQYLCFADVRAGKALLQKMKMAKDFHGGWDNKSARLHPGDDKECNAGTHENEITYYSKPIIPPVNNFGSARREVVNEMSAVQPA